MSLKVSSIKRDLAKEDEGEWISIPEWAGVRFKVRSIASRDYQIAREMLLQKLGRQMGRSPTTPEMEPALGKLVARHLLRGWEGIAGDDESPVEYSPAQAIEYLCDPSMRELEQQVIWASTRVGEREVEFTADAVKNSAVPSATTSGERAPTTTSAT
jgi:hypothetical protein